MKRKTAHLLMALSAILALILVVVFAANRMDSAVTIVVAVWAVVYLILVRFLRCKHCGRTTTRLFHYYCPYCGEPLDD